MFRLKQDEIAVNIQTDEMLTSPELIEAVGNPENITAQVTINECLQTASRSFHFDRCNPALRVGRLARYFKVVLPQVNNDFPVDLGLPEHVLQFRIFREVKVNADVE